MELSEVKQYVFISYHENENEGKISKYAPRSFLWQNSLSWESTGLVMRDRVRPAAIQASQLGQIPPF